MGVSQSRRLTDSEVEELQVSTSFSAKQIEALYTRFKQLDRKRLGVISSHDLYLIPEFSMNLLSSRLIDSFCKQQESSINPASTDSITFHQFISILNVFHPSASPQLKLNFMFNVLDFDGDGYICERDLIQILQLIVGNNVAEPLLQKIVRKTLLKAKQNSAKSKQNEEENNSLTHDNSSDSSSLKLSLTDLSAILGPQIAQQLLIDFESTD